jgi:hypothetical protein
MAEMTFCADCGLELGIEDNGLRQVCFSCKDADTITLSVDLEDDEDGICVCVHFSSAPTSAHKPSLLAWGATFYECAYAMAEVNVEVLENDGDEIRFYHVRPEGLFSLIRDTGECEHVCGQGYLPKVTCEYAPKREDAPAKSRLYKYELKDMLRANRHIIGQFDALNDEQAKREIDAILAQNLSCDLVSFSWSIIGE